MLSRVAESIYWMSRYIERAENVARFISVNLNLSLDLPGQSQQQWSPLIVSTGDNEAFSERYESPTKLNTSVCSAITGARPPVATTVAFGASISTL